MMSREVAEWSWENTWFNILDGFYREKGWSDERIRERLLEKEDECASRGWAPLPDDLNYYSQSFHDRRTLRIRP